MCQMFTRIKVSAINKQKRKSRDKTFKKIQKNMWTIHKQFVISRDILKTVIQLRKEKY